MRETVFVLAVLVAGLVTGGCPADEPDRAPPVRPATPDVDPPSAPAGPVRDDAATRDVPDAPGETPTGRGEIEVIVSAAATAAQGEEFGYSIVVRNPSRVDVEHVVVTDVLPPGVTYVSSTPEASVSGPLLTWQFGALKPYAAEHLTVKVRVTGTGTLTSHVTARADGGLVHEVRSKTEVGGTPAPEAPPPVVPRLTLVQTCEPSVLVCDPIGVRVRIENVGSAEATEVRVEGELPDGLTARDGTRRVSLDAGTLRAGETRELAYEVLAQRTGVFTNTVALRDASGATATASCAVRTTRPVLVLRVEAPATASAGDAFDVRATVENTGDGPANEMLLQVELPPDARTTAGGTHSWDLGSLLPGRSHSVDLRVTGETAGALQCTVSARAHCADEVGAAATTEVTSRLDDLELAVGGPDAATVGDDFEYAIVVRNRGSQDVRDVTVSAGLHGELEYRGQRPPGWPRSGDAGNQWAWGWTLARLRAGESVTLTMVVRTRESEAMIEVNALAPGQKHVSETVRTPVTERALLDLRLTCPESALVCDPVTFQAVVTNNDSRIMANVEVRLDLPVGLQSDSRRQSVRTTVGELRPGQPKTVTLTAYALRTGTFTTTGTATASTGDRSEATCTTSITRPVLTVEAKGPEKAERGAPMEFEITVRNAGDAPARDCVIENPVPAGTTFEGATDAGALASGTVTWSVGVLDPGASKTVTLTLRADDGGSVQSVATARGYCCEEASATAAVQIEVAPPSLRVNCTISKSRLRVGATTECTITVVNDGSSDATNVKVVCALPRQQQAVSATSSPSVAHRLDTRKVTFDPIASLGPRERATFRVVVKAVSTGDAAVTGVVRADGLTRPLRQSSAAVRHVKQKN